MKWPAKYDYFSSHTTDPSVILFVCDVGVGKWEGVGVGRRMSQDKGPLKCLDHLSLRRPVPGV